MTNPSSFSTISRAASLLFALRIPAPTGTFLPGSGAGTGVVWGAWGQCWGSGDGLGDASQAGKKEQVALGQCRSLLHHPNLLPRVLHGRHLLHRPKGWKGRQQTPAGRHCHSGSLVLPLQGSEDSRALSSAPCSEPQGSWMPRAGLGASGAGGGCRDLHSREMGGGRGGKRSGGEQNTTKSPVKVLF